jgi:hypothetical protein
LLNGGSARSRNVGFGISELTAAVPARCIKRTDNWFTFEQPGRFWISANALACKSCIESRILAIQVAASLRRIRDLVLQVAGLMIAAELAQRRLVQLK